MEEVFQRCVEEERDRGRTILLQHDVVSPRPYTRINHVQGTKGAFRDYPARVFFDGQAKEEWGGLDPYRARFEHPLWSRLRTVAIGSIARIGGMEAVGMLERYGGREPDPDLRHQAANAVDQILTAMRDATTPADGTKPPR